MLSRIKFEIEPLVEEILDQLPDNVWTSKSTTFLDPAIGGGQFVHAIENRLRAYGHSNDNIYVRVFGFEDSELHIRYAVNKHKLVGQYVKKSYEKFFELDNTMKFDVVVGNPPYQKENSTAKRWTLWEEFVKFSKTIADTVVMVTPQSITSPGTFDLIKDNATIINIDVSKHFNVGSTFCYWIIDTTKPSTSTKIITDNGEYQLDLSDVNFLPSIITEETLALVNSLNSRPPRTWKRGELHTSNTNLFDANGKYTVMHTNAQTLKSNTEHANKTKIRVAVTLSGYPTFRVITNGYASQACFWTECKTLDEAQALADECNGEEVQKMLSIFKWSGWNSKEVIQCL